MKEQEEPRNQKGDIRKTWDFFVEKRTLKFVPVIIWSGISMVRGVHSGALADAESGLVEPTGFHGQTAGHAPDCTMRERAPGVSLQSPEEVEY